MLVHDSKKEGMGGGGGFRGRDSIARLAAARQSGCLVYKCILRPVEPITAFIVIIWLGHTQIACP